MKNTNKKESFLHKSRSFFQKTWEDTWKNRKYFLWVIIGIIVLHLVLVVAFIIAINKGAFGPLPGENQLSQIKNPVAAEIYTADSVMMGKYYLQNRMDLETHEVTPEIKDALIATEDVRFYEHNGIDVKSLFRVLVKTLMLQKDAGGGSTITQQLAKNLYPRKNYPVGSIVINKLREMVIAQKLEELYTKEQILLLYLNTVPFGEETYGIKAGALRYFHKDPVQLKTEEIALLVGMLKGTSLYSPRTNYENALNRRNVVLHQMAKYDYISTEAKDSLSELEIKLDYFKFKVFAGIAPYFRVRIKPEIENILNEINEQTGSDYNVNSSGLKIYTTIDSRLQYYAEQAVKIQLTRLQKILDRQWENANWENNPKLKRILEIKLGNLDNDSLYTKKETEIFEWETGKIDTVLSPLEIAKYNAKLLQAGFVLVENKTGDIKTWVGGIDHKFFKYDHVTAKRQVGSTFKPFVYLAALEQGYLPCDVFENKRYHYADFDGWSPHNTNYEYEGKYTLKGALTHSINTVSAKLISEIGVSNVVNLAHRAGIKSEIPVVPSIALGTAELSLLELVNTYQTFPNRGDKIKPKFILKIENQHGKLIYQSRSTERSDFYRTASTFNIETMIAMMKNVVNQGTAARLRYEYNIYTDVAGKTGTTQDHADGWFIGFTPEFTAGAWVGADYPAIHFKNHEGQGAYTALPIWARFFQKLYKDERYLELEKSKFEISQNIDSMFICKDYIEPPDIKKLRTEPIKRMDNITTFSTN